MVRTTLVDRKIAVAASFLEHLEAAGISIATAFWFYSTESETWHLYIATSLVDRDGPKGAYSAVQSVLLRSADAGELILSEIKLVSPRDPLVKVLGEAVQVGSGMSGVRLSGNVINGTYIEDAYVYRLN